MTGRYPDATNAYRGNTANQIMLRRATNLGSLLIALNEYRPAVTELMDYSPQAGQPRVAQ